MTKWHWCDRKGESSKDDVGFQMDEVGNILQRTGAIKTKACQKCKTKFKSKQVTQEIIKDVPIYQCSTCKQSNPSGEWAFNHTLEYKDHILKRTTQQKVIGVNVTLEGNIAQIYQSKNDVSILCEKCVEDG